MIRPIYIYNHDILRQPVTFFETGKDLTLLINDMLQTMQNANGIGLAAPQIGLTESIFVIASKEHPVFINSKIVSEHGTLSSISEGCLSIPNFHANVIRSSKVAISWYDAKWNYHEEEFSKMMARVIQHEYDHLLGKLFPDHIDVKNKSILTELRKIKKGVFETKYPSVQ